MAVISRIKGMLTLDIPEGKTQRQSNYIFILVVADVHGLNCWIWINLVLGVFEICFRIGNYLPSEVDYCWWESDL